MKKKITKVATSAIVAGMTVSSFAPMFVVSAQEATTYAVETVPYYVVNEGVESWIEIDIVTNPNSGEILGMLHVDDDGDGKNDYVLEAEKDGYTYAFKDMDKDGELDIFEDWRLDTDTRAKDLAKQLSMTDEGIKKIAGLMLFSSHESNANGAGLTSNQIAYLDNSYVRNITDSSDNNVKKSVGWTNAMQAHVELSDFNVPVDFSSDPRSTAGSGDLYSAAAEGSNLSAWPSNLGMSATFSTEHMYNFAKSTSEEYRAMGIVTALGPQIDLATEPRWIRVGGTFGEDTKLATDMAQAYVDGSQSTYDASGNDVGWGQDSINAMIKHFPGDGSGEGGRESHMDSGKYAVYPGNNFDEHVKPFIDGGMNLNGKTGSATAVMTSYSIGIDAQGNAIGGDAVGSAYSKMKMDLLRNTLEYDGVVCTDWGVTTIIAGVFGMAWGAEHLSVAERHLAILDAGSDMFGGNNDARPVVEAFDMLVARDGDAAARDRFAESAKRLIKLTMEPGLFENPYLDLEESLERAGSAEKMAAGYNAQLESIVMLKNSNNTIQEASDDKDVSQMKVYIPTTYTEEQISVFGNTPAGWSESMSIAVAKTIYGTVITDDYDAATDTYTTPDLSDVDLVIVGMRSPMNGTPFSSAGQLKDANGVRSYYPLSLQYRPYIADGENVRQTSIAGDAGENRSYYGETSRIWNEYDLEACLNAVTAVEATGKDIPVVVAINASSAVIVSEFEEYVDAIVVGFSVSDSAVFDIINGKTEPKGLLPVQFPANMDTVEANLEDVGRDVAPYTDQDGNTYDFAYGLNWDGQIYDERVKEYHPELIPDVTEPTPEPQPTPEPKPGDTVAPTNTNKGSTIRPTTGDNTNVVGYALALSLAAVAGGTVLYKKRKNEE